MTQQQILKTQADAMGITPDQLQKLMDATSTPTGPGSQIRTQNYGGIGYAQPQQGQVSDYQNIVDTLTAYKQAGLSVEPPPPQQPQQQGPSLQDMWNAYMQKGAQQAPAQQPAAAATIAPITPYQGQQLGTATPYASIAPVQSPSLFAPPPPPAPGQQPQQQWQQPQQQQWLAGYQEGGTVVSQNQNPQQQGYLTGDYNQGIINPRYYQSALGSLGGSMIINPWPNQGGQGGQGQDGMGPGGMTKGGVYAGPQLPTVYGSQGMPTPSIAPGSLGQYTFPNGGKLTQAQMAQFMQGTPDEQALVASGLGTTPQAIIQAAQTYQGTTQGGVPFSVQNAPIQRVSPMAGGGAPAVTPGLGFAATMPTPSGGGQPNITPMMPANAAGYRPLGPSGMPQGGQAFATVSAPGQMPIPPSSVTPPPMMMPGGGMFGMGMGQPPAAPGGVANYTAGGVGIQQPPPLQAHIWGLADSGMALYQHMTGEDPKTATPDQIADFHRHFTGMVAQSVGQGPGNVALSTEASPGTAPTTAKPVKAHSGGLITDQGLLTPGEYVHRKQAIGMQSGGPVSWISPTNEAAMNANANSDIIQLPAETVTATAPEVRRKALTVPSAAQMQAAALGPQGASALGVGIGGPQAAAARGVPGTGQGASPSPSNDEMQAAALGSEGASALGVPGAGKTVTGPYSNAEMQAAALGSEGASALGAGGGGGGGPLSQKQGNAIQGVISGLVQAARTYADSVKSFVVHPAPMSYVGQNQRPVQLAQQRVPAAPSQQPNPQQQYYQQYMS